MSEGGLIVAALPSLLAGTSRQPLPVGVDGGEAVLDGLQALSLVGQAIRFEAPGAAAAFEVEHVVEDARRLVPDTTRRPMLRLLTGKMATEHPAMAIARTLGEQHLRPHPFDLPRIDGFVRRYAERLGTTAQQWSQRKAGSAVAVAQFYDQELLEDASWTKATTGRRVAYLSRRRSEDPGAARGLLEGAWANEAADARLRLLEVLGVQLGAEDQPFLESIAADRAPRVRSLAARLLARLGAGADHPALIACLDRIKRTETGLLRKKPVLALELPATVKDQAVPGWIRETFEEISLEELSRGLQVPVAELAEASAKDAHMLLALAVMATAEGELGVLDAVVERLPDAWQRLGLSGVSTPATLSHEERQRWAKILILPYAKDLPWDYSAWSWLHATLDAAAPQVLLDVAFRTDWFAEPSTAVKHTVQWMEVAAALCPASQRKQLRGALSGFEPALTATALSLLDLLDALERENDDA